MGVACPRGSCRVPVSLAGPAWACHALPGQTGVGGVFHEIDGRLQAELVGDAGAVGSDRLGAEIQPFRDRDIAVALAEQAQDLALALAQSSDRNGTSLRS